MNRLLRTLPILLAASLQIMPLVRNLFINPATGSSFAFILRSGIGTAATVGAYDACSGASTVYYTTPSNYTGTVGSYFTNNVAITNNGGDSGAYFFLTNKLGDVSPVLSKGMTTTNCMPPGLTFKCYDLNTGGSPKPVYGAIYGTPTTPITNLFIHVVAAFQALTPAETNIYITIVPAGSSSPPVITNHPAAMTNVAGGMATFSVTAGGGTPLSYQWVFNTNTPLLNATNASLTLTNLRASQAGAYSVAITNSSGGTNSLQATLTVTNPPSPIIGSPAKNIGGLFQFTFVPVIGLTNSVQTNGVVSGGVWNVFTNIPPPVSANPITITDPFGSSNRFYRVLILP